MRFLLVLLFAACQLVAFAQPKTPVITYKPVDAPILSVGDRITIGEIKVIMYTTEHFSIELPSDIDKYKALVQNNPLVTFRLQLNWKTQGVKYPGRSEYTKDSIQHYLNAGAGQLGGTVTEFRHTFLKQEPMLLAELEVVSINARNVVPQAPSATVALPELGLIYRGYNNLFEYTTSGNPDSTWIVGEEVSVTSTGEGKGILRPTGTGRTATITVMARYANETVEVANYMFRVANLPKPGVYIGPMTAERARTVSDSLLFREKQLFVKYPPEILLNSMFQVKEMNIMVGDKAFLVKGNTITPEVDAAIEAADPGTEIVLVKVVAVNGDSTIEFNDVLRRTKITPKGTVFAPMVRPE